MTEYVEHLFNTCPECRPNGKRVFLEFKKGSDYTEPCRECGCKFGKILTAHQRRPSASTIREI